MSSVLELLPMTETAKERSQRPGNYITFIGCDLTESAMKNWLKECAPHVNNLVCLHLLLAKFLFH